MTTPKDYMAKPTVYELSMSRDISEYLTAELRKVVDPAQTPIDFLPFLAAHRGVKLWYVDWTEARQRQMVAEAPSLAALIGTRQASIRFLSYVDASIIDTIAYPSPFIFGKAIIGHTPIGQPKFVARYLVNTETVTPANGFVFGRAVFGSARLKTPSREVFGRSMSALRVAKAPETEIRVDFAHHRLLQISDGVILDDEFYLGQYVERTKLGDSYIKSSVSEPTETTGDGSMNFSEPAQSGLLILLEDI